MAGTERRQARLDKIRARSFPKPAPSKLTAVAREDDVAISPEVHHVIGETENFPVDVGLFFQDNKKDPAFTVRSCSFLTLNSFSSWH